MNKLDERGDRGGPVERCPGPGTAEVTPFGERESSATEAFYRAILVGVACAKRAAAAAQ
jgi:hypothetical protein